MKRALAGIAVLVALATSSQAGAEASAPKAWNDLPSGTAAPPPTKKPSWIGGHEKVADFHVVALDNGGGSGSGVEIFGSAEEAKALREGMHEGLEGCFAEVQDNLRGQVWSLGDPRVVLWSDGSDAVHAVRRERVVEDASKEKATLEIVDAWVDTRTRGTRLIGRSSVPLVRVGGVMSTLRAYAARDDASSGKALHVVVVREGARADAVGSPFMLDDGRNSRGNCEHAHVALRADLEAGDAAVLTTNIALPPLPGQEPAAAADGKAKDERAERREVRVREVEAQLGVSQTSRDKVPVVSVSFGWAGREQSTEVAVGHRFVPKKFRRKK